jgi:HEAT repeat protein
MKNFLVGALAVLACSMSWATTTAQDAPQMTNAKLEVLDAGSNLGATIEKVVSGTNEVAWIAYEIEQVAGRDEECCADRHRGGDSRGGTLWLENEHENWGRASNNDKDGNLEAGGTLVVLLRAEKGRVGRVRVAPASCRLDASGLRFVWLKDAKAGQSVAYLSELVKSQDFFARGDHGMGEQALTAIALHADASADRALEGFAAAGQPEQLRQRAAFWMGAVRGEAGFSALKKMARSEPSSEVRAQVAFALFVSKEAGATDEIVRMAREDSSPHVRGQALFWLAQKAGQKAEKTITGAIADDPDTEVKKKAVFALSQMPKDEGVPKLIELAEKNRNPEVRKQAMFWLGQSGDPRALEFFEKVLRE